MALPTPLTPAQVDGSNDANELRAEFQTGPHEGYVLLVSKTDPNLAAAVRDRLVVVEDPGAFALAPLPPLGAGTEFEGNEVPSPPPQYPIEIDVYVQGSLVGVPIIGTPTSAILTVNGVPRASEPVTLNNDTVSVKYTVPASGTYNFTLTLDTGQSGTTDPLVMLPVV